MSASDAQRIEWEAHERQQLAKGLCPASGLMLTRRGEPGDGGLYCSVCDCFGYLPEEVGKR